MALLTKRKYTFTSSGMDSETFSVVSFKGVEAISKPYEFEIELVSEKTDIDPLEVLENPAKFTIHRDDGDNVAFNGILMQFEETREFHGYLFFRAVLAPKLWWLSLTHHNQVFLNKTVPQIMEEALEDAGLHAEIDFSFDVQNDYPELAYVCQYDESHFDFVSRWAEREGIYYFFEQTPTGEKVVFTDSKIRHQSLPLGEKLRYDPPSGMGSLHKDEIIQTFMCRHSMLPKRVYLKDYNYLKPSLAVEGIADVDEKGRGETYIYGVHFDSVEEGNRLAGIRADSLKCRKSLFTGESTVPYMVPGYTFELTRHYKPMYNRNYLLTEVSHQGHQTGYLISGLQNVLTEHDEKLFYANNFTAIYSDNQFRPEHTIQRPRISGTIHAKIDAAASGEYAELDEHGRYKVILPFDRSGRFGGKASAWFRMMQPYAGENQGMHFPLHKGTEVLLTFIDGNPDRPLIAGAVPNPESKSPVTGANQTVSMIKTGRNDTDQSVGAADARARTNSDPNNYIQFEDNAANPYIKTHSPGNIEGYASSTDSLIKIHTPGNIEIHASEDASLIKTHTPGEIETESGRHRKRRELGTSEESGHDRYNPGGTAQVSVSEANTSVDDLLNQIQTFAPVNVYGFDEEDELPADSDALPTNFPWAFFKAPVPDPPDSYTSFFDDLPDMWCFTDRNNLDEYEYKSMSDVYDRVDDAWEEYWRWWVKKNSSSHPSAKEYQTVTYINPTENSTINAPWYIYFNWALSSSDHVSDHTSITEWDAYCQTEWDEWVTKKQADLKKWRPHVFRGHIRASHRDTFNIQEGNIFDFGGYWNYNLGNNYVEDHIDQSATLNDSYDFDMLNQGGPSWSSFQTIQSSLEGGSKNEIDETWNTGTWSNGSCWVEKKFGDTYEFVKGNTLSVVQGHTQEIVIGGKTIEEKYTPNKAGDGFVKRRYFYDAAGTVKEKKWSKTGFLLEDKYVYTTGANDEIKNNISYDHSAKTNLSWEFASNASLSGSMQAATTNSFYLGAKSNIEINTGVKMDIEVIAALWLKLVTGIGLGAEFDLRLAGVLSNKPGPKLKFEAVGLCAKTEAPLEPRIKTLEAAVISLAKLTL